MRTKPQDGTGKIHVRERSRIMWISALRLTSRDQKRGFTAGLARYPDPSDHGSAVLVQVVRVSVGVCSAVSAVLVTGIAMTEIDCHNCEHEWNYTGEREEGDLVTCPRCYYNTRNEPRAETDA